MNDGSLSDLAMFDIDVSVGVTFDTTNVTSTAAALYRAVAAAVARTTQLPAAV